jgi:hypothetical protein
MLESMKSQRFEPPNGKIGVPSNPAFTPAGRPLMLRSMGSLKNRSAMPAVTRTATALPRGRVSSLGSTVSVKSGVAGAVTLRVAVWLWLRRR